VHPSPFMLEDSEFSVVFEELAEFCTVFLVLLEVGSSGFVNSNFAVSKACARMDSRFVRFLGLILKDP